MNITYAVRCALFTALICVCSITSKIPALTPVPITLQLTAVLTAAGMLGPAWGTLSCILYIALGAFGLPVFAGMEHGVNYMLGPTGGFILGFIPCSYLTGKLSRFFYKTIGTFFMQFASLFVAMSIGTIALYFFGALYFYIVTENTFSKTIIFSVLPFIWIDLFKIIVSACVTRQLLQIFDS